MDATAKNHTDRLLLLLLLLLSTASGVVGTLAERRGRFSADSSLAGGSVDEINGMLAVLEFFGGQLPSPDMVED